MLEFLKKMMGGGNEAQLKKLKKPVDDVMALEEAYKKLTDDQLRAKTDEFRARLQKVTSCLRLSPPSAKRRTGCWACGLTGYRCWAALYCTRAGLPK